MGLRHRSGHLIFFPPASRVMSPLRVTRDGDAKATVKCHVECEPLTQRCTIYAKHWKGEERPITTNPSSLSLPLQDKKKYVRSSPTNTHADYCARLSLLMPPATVPPKYVKGFETSHNGRSLPRGERKAPILAAPLSRYLLSPPLAQAQHQTVAYVTPVAPCCA